MKKLAEVDRVEWTVSHSFFANMGGFVGVSNSPIHLSSPRLAPENEQKPPVVVEMDAVHPGNDCAITIEPSPDRCPPSTRIEEFRQVLFGECLFEMREKGYIHRLPDVTKDEIMDKSKDSVFVKLLTFLQGCWNILQVLLRIFDGVEVPLSPINYSGIAPNLPEHERQKYCKDWIAKQNSSSTKSFREILPDRLRNQSLEHFEWTHVPNDIYDEKFKYRAIYGLAFGAAVSGGFHVAGWDLEFAKPIEQTLWQNASIFITISITLWAIVYASFLAREFINLRGRDMQRQIQKLDFVVAICYVVARLILLVEYFRGLFFLSPEAYISTWVTNIPHID
ncbi:uncharacterized protein LY89DRAFT_774826 [Mollisia scopiformis]|uniref:Uncharacterized protein n=1 Tax=Mollisia scopiformis TaxID=149040 RepID=A0A194XEV2_MOLSC|nr:uncharacterized protein LY89DRAFT_774826 [Mollisia scopiformis]KUJ18720.1 hypothetical protein LY89DRAFT_774826 [Mollisia scopiformis]